MSSVSNAQKNVKTILDTVNELDKDLLIIESLEEVDASQEAEIFASIDEILRRVKDQRELLVQDLHKRNPGRSLEDRLMIIPSGGSIELKQGKPTKKWDNDRLTPIVAEKILQKAIDPETGAIEAPVSQLITEILDYAAISYWRKGALKALGVKDIEEYLETYDPKLSAIVRR